jgi:TonB family protein
MQQAVQRAPDPHPGPVIQAARRVRFAPVNLGVEWGSRGEEFRTSLRDFFTGPRPSKTFDSAAATPLKIDFVEPRTPLRGFAASCLWHVAAIWLMILPIWGFLPKAQPTLRAPQIELTWYTTPADLPRILLPAAPRKAAPVVRKAKPAIKPAATPAAEAYHPRQTILSVPVRVTHPRQTLVEPDAPPEPPKMAPALPNIVQWAASEPPKLQVQLSASTAAPKMERREMRNAAAPDIADSERGARLNLLATDTAPPKLAMPLSASPAMAAKRRSSRTDALSAPAPEIGATSQPDANLRRLIALSATPALPAPKVMVPKGNLAAPIAMSPEGRKQPASNAAGGAAAGEASIAASSPMNGKSSLPATISISGGALQPRSGEARSKPGFRRDLQLQPFSRSHAATQRRSAPARIDIAKLNPALPPETILSGKRIYTMHVNMPDVTSASGSWILNFSELDSGDDSSLHSKAPLSGPLPIFKVDPKYPPELIREHVQGEVVLYAIIRKNGSVDSIRVMRSLDPKLDRDAAAALAQWKFRPGMRAGVPVDIEAVVHIPFNYVIPGQQ